MDVSSFHFATIPNQLPFRCYPMSEQLSQSIKSIQTQCTSCNACKRQCEFLKTYGTPKEIVERFDVTSPSHLSLAFYCSLCGACDTACQEGIKISDLFLEMRRYANATGTANLKPYRPLLTYEMLGRSSLFRYKKIPTHCDTVFFPGCALPGTRPDLTGKLYHFLEKHIPNLGIVLDCCMKPSHDLGRQSFFKHGMEKLYGALQQAGIKKLLVACPNCYKVFKNNSAGIEIITVYEVLNRFYKPAPITSPVELTIHDPCPLREQHHIHTTIRRLIQKQGYSITEMKHSCSKTVCCGEGGAVGFVKPEFAKAWGAIRKKESNGTPVVTYCSGCVNFLKPYATVRHIVDMLFYPDPMMSPKSSRAPFTYLNRLILKLKLMFSSTNQ